MSSDDFRARLPRSVTPHVLSRIRGAEAIALAVAGSG